MSTSGRVTDETLLSLIVVGDTSALRSLYDRHGRTLYSLALRIMGDSHAAEEVLRATFLQLWRESLEIDSDHGSLLVWLLTITRHRAIKRIRKQRAAASGESTNSADPALVPYAGSTSLDMNISKGLFSSAFVNLPDAERNAIALSYFDGLSYEEISGRTFAPVGTVKSDLRSGLHNLKRASRTQKSTTAGAIHPNPVRLEDVLITEQLSSRPSRDWILQRRRRLSTNSRKCWQILPANSWTLFSRCLSICAVQALPV
jgi:RNA polymerase sigma-70 factor, ECF subfamily